MSDYYPMTFLAIIPFPYGIIITMNIPLLSHSYPLNTYRVFHPRRRSHSHQDVSNARRCAVARLMVQLPCHGENGDVETVAARDGNSGAAQLWPMGLSLSLSFSLSLLRYVYVNAQALKLHT